MKNGKIWCSQHLEQVEQLKNESSDLNLRPDVIRPPVDLHAGTFRAEEVRELLKDVRIGAHWSGMTNIGKRNFGAKFFFAGAVFSRDLGGWN
jgi:hypothetical protein